jgi:hypothetical protein
MLEQTSAQLTFTGAHPTNREFVEQLTAWGFARRKEEGVHIVFRGPHGGTLRVIRSLLGRADAERVDKAARLVRVTPDQFWEGPKAASPDPRRTATAGDVPRHRRIAPSDRVTSVVLGIHASEDRPLGFDQVVELVGGKVTRDQVRTASALLCREGDLDRIRSGVYQWSKGARTRSRTEASAQPSTGMPEPAPQIDTVAAAHNAAAVLFNQLFPTGIRMTAEAVIDVARWADLTEKLASYAEASRAPEPGDGHRVSAVCR